MLISERNQWKKQLEQGSFEEPYLLTLYRQNRNNELWRSTRIMEQLCEYILFLESRLKE